MKMILNVGAMKDLGYDLFAILHSPPPSLSLCFSVLLVCKISLFGSFLHIDTPFFCLLFSIFSSSAVKVEALIAIKAGSLGEHDGKNRDYSMVPT